MTCFIALNRLYCYWDKAVLESHTIESWIVGECYEFPISSKINVERKGFTSAKRWQIGKKFRNHIADTVKSKEQTKEICIEHESPIHLAPHTHQENIRGKIFFSQKPDRKISIMLTSNNNSHAIPTTDRQGVSNRDMVGITTPQQTFFSMDVNPGKPI